MFVAQLRFDGAFHNKLLEKTPTDIPITLDDVRTQAHSLFEREERQLQDSVQAVGSNKSAQLLRLICQRYKQLMPPTSLPQHPQLPGYLPDQRRVIQLSQRQRQWTQKLGAADKEVIILGADGQQVCS